MEKQKISLTDRIFDSFNYMALLIFMIVCMYPFYYIFIYSFSDPLRAQFGVSVLPVGFSLINYEKILAEKSIYGATLISLLRTVVGTGITVFSCALFSYVLTKPELYFRKAIYRFLVVTMYLSAGLIPWYLTIRAYGLRNNFLVYIIPSAVSAFFIILIKTYLEQLPASLEESAMIDGAGYFTIFCKVILPLSKPIIATIVMFSSVNQWNSWFDTYIFCQSSKLYTLQYTLLNYLQESKRLADMVNSAGPKNYATLGQMAITPESAKMSITMLAVAPILLMYPFMQKYFVKGIMMGAIKG